MAPAPLNSQQSGGIQTGEMANSVFKLIAGWSQCLRQRPRLRQHLLPPPSLLQPQIKSSRNCPDELRDELQTSSMREGSQALPNTPARKTASNRAALHHPWSPAPRAGTEFRELIQPRSSRSSHHNTATSSVVRGLRRWQ